MSSEGTKLGIRLSTGLCGSFPGLSGATHFSLRLGHWVIP